MVLESLVNLFPEPEGSKPNKYTRYMGEAIKQAREAAGLSQEKLAELVYKRRATLSDIENGKVDVDALTLALIGAYVKKPLSYFYPPYLREEFTKEELSPLEHELLLHFEQIHGEELQKLAIQQVKLLGEFDPQDMVLELTPIIAEKLERDQKIREAREKRRKKK